MSAPKDTLRPNFVYELRDKDGVLLYVGITQELGSRLRGHARAKPWWDRVADVKAILYPNRAAARDVEKTLIAREDPTYNVDGHPLDAERRTYTWSLQSLRPRDPLPPDHLLDFEEMATWMRYAVTTVKNYYRKNELPPPDEVRGRTLLWRVSTIDEWDARRKGLIT